jgi:diaminohydroxyphosphoribosylaminopyrimidine deaminase/5-amino-6-(5-phosphoribosylamino)uracil reductase
MEQSLDGGSGGTLKRRFTDKDAEYMRRALELAARGRGITSPNPMVGAVLVKHGEIIGEGFHEGVGKPHAEIAALRSAAKNPQGATLYINLEPCCHFGRTPPCTDELIRARIARVVAAMHDPNKLVCGKGFAQLRRAGIAVHVGLLRAEAEQLNEAFAHFHRTDRPFVILKWAMTLDGRTATSGGGSRWITGAKSRRYAHELRSQVDGVLVGIGTLLQDDPRLTVRLAHYHGRQPARIILDSDLKIPLRARCLEDCRRQKTVIATTHAVPKRKIEALRSRGCAVVLCRKTKDGVSLSDVMRELAALAIQSLLVEGGRTVAGSFLRDGLVNKIVASVGPSVLGGKKLTSPVANWEAPALNTVQLRNVTVRRFDDDVCIEGYLRGLEEKVRT